MKDNNENNSKCLCSGGLYSYCFYFCSRTIINAIYAKYFPFLSKCYRLGIKKQSVAHEQWERSLVKNESYRCDSCGEHLLARVENSDEIHEDEVLTLITAFSWQVLAWVPPRSSGTLMSLTCPVARSSKNSAGFIEIWGMNLIDEKYSRESLALP